MKKQHYHLGISHYRILICLSTCSVEPNFPSSNSQLQRCRNARTVAVQLGLYFLFHNFYFMNSLSTISRFFTYTLFCFTSLLIYATLKRSTTSRKISRLKRIVKVKQYKNPNLFKHMLTWRYKSSLCLFRYLASLFFRLLLSFFSLSVCLPLAFSLRRSRCLAVCLSFCLSSCLSSCLSFCLSPSHLALCSTTSM
jgi:hypothetical protein